MSKTLFDQMFLHEDDAACEGSDFTYDALSAALAAYPTFCAEGTLEDRQREAAAFLANISHETTGGWPSAPDGPFAWGLCFREEVGCGDGSCTGYCDAGNVTYPCEPGKTYHGRGPMQLSWNYNYGQAGEALNLNLLQNPEQVADDAIVGFRTALWFWQTEQLPKPSAHDVMVGNWQPTANDIANGRVPGFGMTINIINGGIECGKPTPSQVEDRVGFYQRYCDLLDVDYGDNLYCDQMSSF